MELLLQGGCAVSLRNKRQRTPLDCAQEVGGKVRAVCDSAVCDSAEREQCVTQQRERAVCDSAERESSV